MNPLRKGGKAEGPESLQNGNHFVLGSGQGLLITADPDRVSGQSILQKNGLLRLGLCDDTGDRQGG